jgi:hypothetical protein
VHLIIRNGVGWWKGRMGTMSEHVEIEVVHAEECWPTDLPSRPAVSSLRPDWNAVTVSQLILAGTIQLLQ